MEEKLFNDITFEHRISVKINELNNVTNIQDILYIKLYDLYNTCLENGYIKEDSIRIISYSNGYLNPVIFVPFVEYRVKCVASIFLPYVDDVYLVKIISINKIGIMCKLYYNNNNYTYSPINVIIAKHTQNANIYNLKNNDLIYVKIVALKFNKGSKYIQSIGDIIDDNEIKLLKDYSQIIKKLITIDLNFNIDETELQKYKNIVKFILDKDNVSLKELFIYNFIKNNNIDNKSDYIKLYNVFIETYNIKFINNIIVNDIDTELTNNYENLECETNDTDINDKSSNIDDYDIPSIIDNSEDINLYLENEEELTENQINNSDSDDDSSDSDDDNDDDDDDNDDIDVLEEKDIDELKCNESDLTDLDSDKNVLKL